jgi:putative NIF3 family GTP cyclohydrolase 1 type 2
MKTTELFRYVIEKGMARDPRGKEGLDRLLADRQKEFDGLPEESKWEFDEECLWNPYDDSRILYNPDDAEVKRVLMGVNIDSAELLVADRLREKGERVDLVIGHHPRGIGQPGLHKVMDVQVDLYARWGVPPNVGEQLMDPRINEVMRAVMPQNHQQSVDTAKLIGMPFMCTHSPADILVQEHMQDRMNEAQPFKVSDVIDVFKTIPEYRNGIRLKNGPRIILGSGSNRAGKVVVKMAGGTGGAKTMYEAFEKAGVGTYIAMHVAEDHIELARKHHINLIVAGHMPSDSLGMNLMYQELETSGELEIVRYSGLIPPTEE